MESAFLSMFTAAYWGMVAAFLRVLAKEPSDSYRRPAPVGSRYVSVGLAAVVLYSGCLTAIVWILGGEVTWWISFWMRS